MTAAGVAVLSVGLSAGASAANVQISTYHGDAHRTGWNPAETILTPAAVGGSTFGQVGSVALDAQVDAQPLYVSGQTITGRGSHNVIYTVTENNTVYAIDGDTGAILLQKNFGTPVSISQLPGACNNNSNIVGITSTPVLDTTAQTLYVITYTYENAAAVYRLHALDLATLVDKTTPVVITGSGTLNPSNAKYAFNPSAARARPALLLNGGNVYAAFTSFCDFNANIARGWVLGWNAASLAPLAQPALLNRESQTTNNYFLSTVWMSGYGPAVDNAGSIFVTTGNSDPAGTAYNPPYGIAESVVKLSSDLKTVQSIFTPAGKGVDYKTLEATDGDFSSGGVLVLPTQPGAHPNMAVAAGKAGVMYLLNTDDLGGYNEGPAGAPDRMLNSYVIGSCYCGASYYQAADGVGRVVSSGNNTAVVWKVNTTLNPTFSQESISNPIVNGTNHGFFTTVSSNGTQANSQVIWALGRPIDKSPAIMNLYAFDPSTIDGSGKMKTLFTAGAGSWPQSGSANLVPTVANGRVYVATYKQLAIFGLTTSTTTGVISFTASGTQAAGVGPLVNVIVDGKAVGTTSVGTAKTTYAFNAPLAANTAHDIQIAYTNDTVINGQDRNLILNSIGINGSTILATSPYEIYHSKAGGGPGDLASNGNMYWTGIAEFSLPASQFPNTSAAVRSKKMVAVAKIATPASVEADASPTLQGHAVYGVLVKVGKNTLTLRTRAGLLTVDNTAAVKAHHSVLPLVGGALLVHGQYTGANVLHASSILRVENLKTLWGKDS